MVRTMINRIKQNLRNKILRRISFINEYQAIKLKLSSSINEINGKTS